MNDCAARSSKNNGYKHQENQSNRHQEAGGQEIGHENGQRSRTGRQGRAESRQGNQENASAAKKARPAAQGRKATVLTLISRPDGATLGEIMKATGWQAHSVRGLISTLGSKEGLKLASTKNEAGERVYQHQA